MRQSNRLAAAETHRAFVSDWNQTVFIPMLDPVVADVIRRGAGDFDSLTGDEQIIATGFWGSLMFLTEEVSHLHDDGMADPEFTETAVIRAASILRQPGAARWWEFAQRPYTDEFADRMNAVINGPNPPPSFDNVLPWFGPDRPEWKGRP